MRISSYIQAKILSLRGFWLVCMSLSITREERYPF